MTINGTYHYIVADKIIIGVYGSALREIAFEKANELRNKGKACEVLTRTGKRACVGEALPRD